MSYNNNNVSTQVLSSKYLSWILRHGLKDHEIDEHGWCTLDVLRQYRPFSMDELQQIVDTDSKQRFELQIHEQKIRAVQGHSIGKVQDAMNIEIHSWDAFCQHFGPTPKVIHGTYKRHLTSIQQHGLQRMQRNYIHFTTDRSKCRKDCNLFLQLDLIAFFEQGHKLYICKNGVINVQETIPFSLLSITA